MTERMGAIEAVSSNFMSAQYDIARFTSIRLNIVHRPPSGGISQEAGADVDFRTG